MSTFQTLLTTRLYWLAICALSVCMLAVALYFQYSVGDEPCQVCIHVRIWTSAMLLLSLVMSCFKFIKPLYLLGNGLMLVSVIGLLERSYYLLTVENGVATKSCQFFLGFPSWFALDQWMPWLFEVRALCSFTPDMPWGLSMAQSLLSMGFGLLVVVLLAFTFMLLKKPE